METFDIVLDDSGDFQNSGGDFKSGDATNNYIRDIIVAHPGHYKEFPEIGVGISQYLQAVLTSPAVLERAIRSNLEYTGFKSVLIDVSKFESDGSITVTDNSK